MELSPLWISLKVAVLATLFSFALGVTAARLVSGAKKGKFLWDSLLSLPLVLPPTVTGFFLLILFGRNTYLGKFFSHIGTDIIFTARGAVIAAFVVSFPIVYRTVRGAFENMDHELVDVARMCGYSDVGILFKVYIPMCWQEITAACVIAFARAIGEFGATIMIAGNLPGKTRTMSTAVYTAMQSGNRAEAYRWVAVILALSFIVLMILNIFGMRTYSREYIPGRKRSRT